jgi:murein L,D-transpeptidase YcbB/YkuD
MLFRTPIAALASVAALLPATCAWAETVADATVAESDAVTANYTVYDRAIDPTTAAIRAILGEAGKHGAFLDKRDAAAVAEYYREQGYAPSWTDDGRLTARAKKIIARLARANIDGLDPRAYRTPPMGMGESVPATISALAAADVMLSQAIVTYARHAHSGLFDPADISPNFGYKPHLPDPIAVLRKVASASDPAAALASYNPTHPEFVALRDKLAEIRAANVELPPVVPEGPQLKLGSKGPRVATLRQRLSVPPPAPPAEQPQAIDSARPSTRRYGRTRNRPTSSSTASPAGQQSPRSTPPLSTTSRQLSRTWSAGGGCRKTLAGSTSASTSPTSTLKSTAAARWCIPPASSSASRPTRRRSFPTR